MEVENVKVRYAQRRNLGDYQHAEAEISAEVVGGLDDADSVMAAVRSKVKVALGYDAEPGAKKTTRKKATAPKKKAEEKPDEGKADTPAQSAADEDQPSAKPSTASSSAASKEKPEDEGWGDDEGKSTEASEPSSNGEEDWETAEEDTPSEVTLKMVTDLAAEQANKHGPQAIKKILKDDFEGAKRFGALGEEQLPKAYKLLKDLDNG